MLGAPGKLVASKSTSHVIHQDVERLERPAIGGNGCRAMKELGVPDRSAIRVDAVRSVENAQIFQIGRAVADAQRVSGVGAGRRTSGILNRRSHGVVVFRGKNCVIESIRQALHRPVKAQPAIALELDYCRFELRLSKKITPITGEIRFVRTEGE